MGAAAGGQHPGHLPGHGGQLPRRRTGIRRQNSPTGSARDPPALGGPATGHRPGGGRPGRHRRSHGCLRCRQAGGRAEHGAQSAAARGSWMIDLDTEAAVARAIQKSAAAAHASQSDALPQLTRRLDLLDGSEQLRWLVSPAPEPGVSDLPAGQHAHRCRHIAGCPGSGRSTGWCRAAGRPGLCRGRPGAVPPGSRYRHRHRQSAGRAAGPARPRGWPPAGRAGEPEMSRADRSPAACRSRQAAAYRRKPRRTI